MYPESVQIIDFYHAIEKIGAFASQQFKKEVPRREWLYSQKKLLDGKVEEVIRYYRYHQKRMKYKQYLDKGYTMGSSAIESVHRNVIQQRMKLSGQRWSIKGVQNMTNLRACKKSN